MLKEDADGDSDAEKGAEQGDGADAGEKAEDTGGKKRKGGAGGKGQKRQRIPAPSSDDLMEQAARGFGFMLHASGGTSVTGTMQVPSAYIGNVIGKGGFTIKCETCCQILSHDRLYDSLQRATSYYFFSHALAIFQHSLYCRWLHAPSRKCQHAYCDGQRRLHSLLAKLWRWYKSVLNLHSLLLPGTFSRAPAATS